MEPSAPLRKPLHPFTVFVIVATAVIVALDVVVGVLTYQQLVAAQKTSAPTLATSGFSLQMDISFWVQVAKATLGDVAYLIGLAVVIELIDRILWRLTPEGERRVGRMRQGA